MTDNRQQHPPFWHRVFTPWSSSPGSAQAVEKGCFFPTSWHRVAEPERESGVVTVSHLLLLPLGASLGCRGQVGPYHGIRFRGAQMSEGARALGGAGATCCGLQWWACRGPVWLLAAKSSLASPGSECGGSLSSV